MPTGIFLDTLTRDPVFYVSVVVTVIVSITLHELGHGVVALWQGDDTPRVTGHLTADPRVHMPPFSWLLLFLVGISYGLMPVNPRRFRSRYGHALVAVAGPSVNLGLAFLGLTALGLWLQLAGVADPGYGANGQRFLLIFGSFNLVLCIFNLLPVPPLDGSSVLADVSPAFRRLVSDPGKQPLFMGLFFVIFFFSDWIWTTAYGVADAYLALFGV